MIKNISDEKLKNYIFITLIIGVIADSIIESGMNIVILCSFIYIVNKYISTTENIEEYLHYEFKDKEKFEKGKKRFAWILYIYLVIRIFTLIIKPTSNSVSLELFLLIYIYIPYENNLIRKYVIRRDEEQEKIKVVLAKNKIFVSSILVLYLGFTFYTYNSIKNIELSEHIKYLNNEYKIETIDNTRKIEIKLSSTYMMAEENKENAAYFDDFLMQGKAVIKENILKSYLFISMLVMLGLCFVELYPKNNYIKSRGASLFLLLFVVFAIITFNFDMDADKLHLINNFHNKISS